MNVEFLREERVSHIKHARYRVSEFIHQIIHIQIEKYLSVNQIVIL